MATVHENTLTITCSAITAIDLMKDWRLDRYYAARIKLFDVVLNEVPEAATPAL